MGPDETFRAPEAAGLPERWWRLALAPPRALGVPLGVGRLRREPEDFQVEEDLGFAPAGTGQHVLLRVRKRDANTQWVARELARACPCRPFDIGYAGLKDRHAVAVQWFTVPRGQRSVQDWTAVRGQGFEVLEAHAHTRKLPRGALAGNHFVIRIRDVSVPQARIGERMQQIARQGVPNYFGPQRFGRQGGNLARIPTPLRELRAPERGFVLSAARSLIFNAVLARRVEDRSWSALEPGDLAGLDGRGSFFAVTATEEALLERCVALDVHPTGPMWGAGDPATQSRIAQLEHAVAMELAPARELVTEAGLTQERRSLRSPVRDLEWSCEGSEVRMRFRMGRGSFATAVLRELFTFDSTDEALSPAE